MTKEEWIVLLVTHPGVTGTQGGEIEYWYKDGAFYCKGPHDEAARLCNPNNIHTFRYFTHKSISN